MRAKALLLGLALSSQAHAIRVSAVGDILLWFGPMQGTLRQVKSEAQTPWDTAVYPFERVEPYLQGLVFGNLEGPLTAAPPHRFKPAWMKYYFKSPAGDAVAALKQGGFRVLNVANNHSMDSGAKGLRDTLSALREGDIESVGGGANAAEAAKPLWVSSAQGGQVCFLAACAIGPKGTFAEAKRAGAWHLDKDALVKAVRREAKTGVPVIVSLHWGIEQKRDLPVADPEAWQVETAHALIDAGAVAVFGHHTHAVSRFEEYKSGLIAYSLGNFCFSGARYPKRTQSVILHCDLDAKGVHRWDLLPVRIDDPERPFQPAPLRKDEGQAYLAAIFGGQTYARYRGGDTVVASRP
jgi:poly-gamma-glutamate synthesis protein (capsule biosynthesis protein)